MEFVATNWREMVVVLSSLYMLPPLLASVFLRIKLKIWINFNPEDKNISQYREALQANRIVRPLGRIGLFFVFVMFFSLVYSSLSRG